MYEESNPKITTVIPTYRRPQFLKYAIQSALDQTYSNIIVLVCDNASNDETKSVAMSFKDPRVRYHCQPENVSLEDNFESGLNLVTTPYYSFLGDDDFLFPQFYETALAALSREQQAMLFCGGALIIDEKRSILDKTRPLHEGLWNISSCPIEHMTSVFTQGILQSCVFRKGEHEKLPRKGRKGGWDIVLTLNVMMNYPIVTSSKFVVGYRAHSKSVSRQGRESIFVLNSELCEQSLIKPNDQIKEKIRYTDDPKNKWKDCIKMILIDSPERASFYYSLAKSHSKTTALFLNVFSTACKIKIFRQFFNMCLAIYAKNKERTKKNLEDSEFFDLINKYTFVITD